MDLDFNKQLPKISEKDLRKEIRKEYASVARDPHKGYHFHTGRTALKRIGYDESIYAGVPEGNIASFAGSRSPQRCSRFRF